MTPFLAHSTPFRSHRSLSKVSTNSGEAQRLKTKLSPVGRTATSSRSFDTSMPTTNASIRSHPCANGLLPRPKRLFGFDGTAGEDTHSLAGSPAHRFFGLSPATALSTISGRRDGKLQGFLAHRSH